MANAFIPPPDVFATFPTPNYVDPQTRGQYTTITAGVCGILSIAFVALRFVAKVRIRKGFGWDDFWIAFGLLFSVMFFLNIVLGIKLWGWKYHIYDLPPKLYRIAAIIDVLAIILFLLATSGIRLSLLSFYLHLIKDAGSRIWKYAIYGFVVLTVIMSLAFGLTSVLRCTPVSAFWAYPMPAGAHCFDENIVVLVGGCLVVVADLTTMLLPLPVILGLKMPLRKRVSVAILLSLGLTVTFVSIARTYYLWRSLVGTYDVTWESHPLLICGSVEIVLSITCACVPSIKPLYERFWNWLENHKVEFRTFLGTVTTGGSTAVGSGNYSRATLSKKHSIGLSLNVDSADFKGGMDGMYPMATFTTIHGQMRTVDEEEFGSPQSWLSGKEASVLYSPTSPLRMSAQGMGTRGISDLDIGLDGGEDSAGITVVTSVQVSVEEAKGISLV